MILLAFSFLFAVTAPASPQKHPSAYERALRDVQQGRLTSAVALLERILRDSPGDLRAQNLMGLALTASGRLREANAYFASALQLNPQFVPALKNLAINELNLNQLNAAGSHLEQVLKISPRDLAAHLALGEICFRQQKYARAVRHYDQAGELPFRSPETILDFARSCLESNQPAKARCVLVRLGPEASARTHFEAGLMLARLDDYEGAARRFELARKDYGDPYQVGFNLALAYIKAQKYSRAIGTARELTSSGYPKAELYNLLADAYERNGQTVEAYDALRTATQMEPGDENNYLDLVALGVDHANYDLALGIVDIGLQNIPNSFRLLLQRGAVRAFQGQLTKAMSDFEGATKLDPRNNLPYFAMVMALMQTDQTTKAKEILRQKLAGSPDHYLLLYALGEVLDRSAAPLGSPEEEEAIKALERSVQLEPAMAQSRVALGRMLLRRGEVDRAIAELEKALGLESTDLTPCYQLSLAYRRKGNKRLADELQARFERFKAEDRERFRNRNILRLLRAGDK